MNAKSLPLILALAGASRLSASRLEFTRGRPGPGLI